MYFLDFDRTLFDADAFIEHLLAARGTELPHEASDDKLREILRSLLERETSPFTAGELAPFVYPDVPEFLRAAGNAAVILTFGNPTFQRWKVQSALAGIPRISALYTVERRKGVFLKERIHAYSGELVFVDDHPIELEDMARECPQVRVFEMRRKGGEGDGRWPVVRSLAELP